MTGSRVMLGILAVAILVGGFSAGRLLGQLAGAERSIEPTPSASATPAELPTEDEPGNEIAGLPRYPGSTRTAYGREVSREQVLTSATYVMRATSTDVRAFYVDAFHAEGWEIVDLGFSRGTWSFALERGPRQASVEIEDLGDLVEARFEVARDVAQPTPPPSPQPTERPTPVPATPPPPPPSDDDDDGDDGPDDDDSDDDDSDDGASDD